MNDRLRRHRKVTAVVAGLALAASISVVAPAAASAREVGARKGTTAHVQTGQQTGTGVPTKRADVWEW